VSATADSAAGQHGLVDKLGIAPSSVVQEIGWDDDCDDECQHTRRGDHVCDCRAGARGTATDRADDPLQQQGIHAVSSVNTRPPTIPFPIANITVPRPWSVPWLPFSRTLRPNSETETRVTLYPVAITSA